VEKVQLSSVDRLFTVEEGKGVVESVSDRPLK
jgi:hypothetical protein